MIGVTRILARNLSEAARTRLGGATEVYMDTPEGFRVPFTKEVERLSDINKIKIEGALRASLDYTEVNAAVLVDFSTPLSVNNRKKWVDVLVTIDGVPSKFTRMYVVAKNDDSGKWEVEFALPADHWTELASAKLINTIDFGGYRLTPDNVENSWDNSAYVGDYTPNQDVDGWNPAYGMWPVDYGDWVDRTTPAANETDPAKMMAVEDIRPHVSLVYLLKRGFCEIGWDLGGFVLETEWSRSLWAYLLRKEYYTGNGYDGVSYGKYGRVVGRIIDADLTFGATSVDKFIYFTELDYVGASGFELPFQGDPSKWMCGIKNPLPFKSKFKFSFKFELEAHPSVVIDQSFSFNIQELDAANTDNDEFTGEILSADASFSIGPSETKFVSFDLECELEPGQKGALAYLALFGSLAGIIKKGMWFRCEPNNEAFTREDEIDLRTALDTKLTLLDMAKAYVHLCNGRLETDYAARAVNIYPERSTNVYGEDVSGFIREDFTAEDVSADILPGSIRINFIRPELKRYTQLAFADSSDDYIDSLTLSEELHSRKIFNGEDLPNETDERKNPVFEPTAEGQSTLLKRQTAVTAANGTRLIPSPYLPRYWDNTDGQRSFDIGPRILVGFGLIRQVNQNLLDAADKYAKIYWESYSTARAPFGYATQLRTWVLYKATSTDPPDNDFNVVFGRQAADLFVNFYLGLTQDNRGGMIIDALQMVTMAQYSRFNFRALCTFVYEGRQLRVPMTSIRDFSPGIPTPVTYFASPAETSCCDLPCSCRFTTCDYYQDLGLFIRQSTMDALTVSSFKIDNKEQLTAPVSLGQINVVDIGGGSYVTNLVDALNSIGAPYFYFGYSTRVHPDRGMRFFTIKRPTCQTFEIIVSDSGDDVYRYTDTQQQEQWFAGSWGAIGYGTETFTAPDNCAITVEY